MSTKKTYERLTDVVFHKGEVGCAWDKEFEDSDAFTIKLMIADLKRILRGLEQPKKESRDRRVPKEETGDGMPRDRIYFAMVPCATDKGTPGNPDWSIFEVDTRSWWRKKK